MANDFIKEFFEELNEMGKEAEDITTILELWSENSRILKQQEKLDKRLRTKIKTFLKERNWDRYNDKASKVNVSIVTQSRENIDKSALITMLKASELAQVTRTISFEKMLITNPDMRTRLRKNVK